MNGLIAWLWGKYLTHNHSGGSNGALLSGAVPSGTVMVWTGSAASIPAGWTVATELNGRFARGASLATNGGSGGADNYDTTHAHGAGTLATDSAGDHTHPFTLSGTSTVHGTGGGGTQMPPGEHSHVGNTPVSGASAHTVSGSTGTSGSSQSHLPPYLSYYYIYKV